MTTEQNKALVRAVLEESVQDMDIMREHPGLHEVMPMISLSREASSDVQVTITLIFAEGDWVETRSVYSGTMTGAFMGIPPTGKAFEYEVLAFNQVVDGKIVKQHSQADMRSMMQQMGVQLPMGGGR